MTDEQFIEDVRTILWENSPSAVIDDKRIIMVRDVLMNHAPINPQLGIEPYIIQATARIVCLQLGWFDFANGLRP